MLLALVSPQAGVWAANQPKVASAAPLREERVHPGRIETFEDWTNLVRTSVTLSYSTSRSRLDSLGVVILEETETHALILADAMQLEKLARLRFRPRASDDLGILVHYHADTNRRLLDSLQPLLAKARDIRARSLDTQGRVGPMNSVALQQAQIEMRSAMHSLTTEQQQDIVALNSIDSDGDGLTDTEEYWWCTDPLNPDSKGDGVSDGDAVAALMSWMYNELPGPPASGTPFKGWPMVPGDGQFNPECVDQDRDSVPDLAERWMLGLNPNRESTSRDKFDDGQKLFGITAWNWGALPGAEDTGVIFAEMPAWVSTPGNHPLVAAYPVPEIDVVESSLRVETVTVVTTDHTITEGTERSYSTARTDGTSTGISDMETWNDWQEVSTASSQRALIQSHEPASAAHQAGFANFVSDAAETVRRGVNWGAAGAFSATACFFGDHFSSLGEGICKAAVRELDSIYETSFSDLLDQNEIQRQIGSGVYSSESKRLAEYLVPGSPENSRFDPDHPMSWSGIHYQQSEGIGLISQQLHELSHLMAQPIWTNTQTTGRSWGGSQTTTHTQYEEHTITDSEAFSSSESWSTATAVNSAHAADLWFTYRVRNSGTDYAREIANLAFNIFIGDDPNPAITHFVASDLGGDGKFHNFMPGDEHTYTSRRIALSLEQMRAVDLGGPVRIVVEDFSYGDEPFYQDAINSGVLIAIDDGLDDGNEAIDTYVIPTWGTETVMDVLARYFPHTLDAYGNLVAIWTPKYRADTPAWCDEPRVVGSGAQRTLWCRKALSTADWWSIYTSGLGDGSEGFQDTPASPGSIALFRFNKDSDLDGYSDRSELRLGTDPHDPTSYPRPELLAGVHSVREGDRVTATLSLLNTGLYDAYGVEAIMIAPNDTISITYNTVGGSGRVRALREVVVGSRILLEAPLPAPWTQSGHAQPTSGGYYTGQQDRTYTFTVQCGVPSGCDVSDGAWALAWDDGAGASGTLDFSAGYASPTLLPVGAHGLKLGMMSGHVANGESFAVEARTPRDTFQYAINAEPFTPPVVVVSYNDPQGNHRFIIPPEAMALSSPTDDLVLFAGQMLQDPGVEIVTTEAAGEGSNTTDLVVNNPTGVKLTNAHLFLNFVDMSGTVASEAVVTATLPSGPSVIPVAWDTGVFSPTFQTGEEYIVLAFLTDWQGNILDTAGRPLSSFQADPRPTLSTDTADLTWNFGVAAQGTLMKHSFPLANTGHGDLALYVEASGELVVSPIGVSHLEPSDVLLCEVMLDTADLPLGPYSEMISLRTNDPDHPVKTLEVLGSIVEPYHPSGALRVPGLVSTHGSERKTRVTSGEVIIAGSPSDTAITFDYAPQSSYYFTSIDVSFVPNPPGYSFVNSVSLERCGVANYHWLTSERLSPNPERYGPWDQGSLNPGVCQHNYVLINWSYPSSSVYKTCVGASDTPVPSSAFYDHPNNRCYRVWRTSSGIGQRAIFDIVGRVTDVNGNGLSGVTISLSTGQSVTTNSSGNYRFRNIDQGTYTVTASRSGYVFSPASRTVTGPRQPLNTTPDVVNQNFTAQKPASPVIDSGLFIEGSSTVAAGSSVRVRFRVINSGDLTWSRSDVRARATGPATVYFPTQSMTLSANQTGWYDRTAVFGTAGVYTICGGYGSPDGFTTLGGSCPTLQVITPADPTIESGVDIVGNDTVAPGESVTVRFTVRNNGQVTWSRSDVRAQAVGPTTVLYPEQSMILSHNETATYEQALVLDVPGTYTICGGYGNFTPLSGGQCAILQVLEMEEVRYIRLRAVQYETLTLDLELGDTGSGAYSVEIDVGANEAVDWMHSGVGDRPVVLTTDNLAEAFNAYLQTYSETVDVPVHFRVTTLPLRLHNFVAVAAEKPDIAVTGEDITFHPEGAAEGNSVTVSATLSNLGADDSPAFTVAFYADAGIWGDIYIGSALVPGIQMGETATATIQWDSLGFAGELPVHIRVDPHNRLSEEDKGNNQATANVIILTRPDLHPIFAEFSNPEPVVGETITVLLRVDNLGQAAAESFDVSLYDGNPSDEGELLQTVNLTVPGEDEGIAAFTWTPIVPGPQRLFSLVDVGHVINDPDRSNNLSWQDIYVGFDGPLLLDSGGATDPAYAASTGYGVLDEGPSDVLGECGSAPHERFRLDPAGRVVYRFDHLLPGHFYHLDVTMYECDGASRQQTIRVNGHSVAGPIDLGDGQVHRLSLLLDPALYTGHMIRVEIEAEGVDGALVNEVSLHDVDYRYADAGGLRDPQYPGGATAALGRPYGWLNGVHNTAWGTLPYQSVRVNQTDNLLQYRFDGLQPEKRYNVHLTFWQPSGAGRIQRVQLDGLDTGLTVKTGDYQLHRETVAVPPAAYADDGSVIVGVLRINADSGAIINELALEEETLPRAIGCDVEQTPYFTDVYGDVTILSEGAPAGTVIEALNPRGETVGCFVVSAAGQYGFMRIYGEDTTATPPIPGMRAGELTAFRVNGAPAVAAPLLYWQADYATQRVDLNAGSITGQSVLLNAGWNLISFRPEPAVPTLRQVLDSVDGRYDRVLGETGAYAPSVPDVYNTLKELHPGQGYYVRITGPTAASALIEGLTVPVSTPITLHTGWNWIGYLPAGTLPITQALQSIDGEYQRVLSLDKTYDPSLPEYSTLRLMEPGRGYLIHANQAVTLTYPAGSTTASVEPQGVTSAACAGLAPTPTFMLLYGELWLGGQPAPAGSLLEVLTPRGEIAGCFELDRPGVIGLMHVYGEDTTATPPIDGFRDGEPLAFRVNGVLTEGEVLYWSDDWSPHAIALSAELAQVYLPIVIRGR